MAFVRASVDTSFVLAQGSTNITSTTGAGGLATTVTVHDHTVQITGGTRPGNGANLFHSFAHFNVGRGETAEFLNTTPALHTSNILSRVTDGTPSSIFGTIDSTSYVGANLFLMNPAGIVFGPNATLHVGGSVAFTTADYLRLAGTHGSNAGIFHAHSTATNLLTNAPVAAFGFLGATPAAIAVQGSTMVAQPGQSISLVGGNQGFRSSNVAVPDGVTITTGHLNAAGGRIHIVSVASPGEIVAGTLDQASNINGQSFGPLGAVQISKDSEINTTGTGDGTILIRGGRLVIDASKLSANSGNILLDAASIRVTGDSDIATETTTAANAGSITLKASGDITLDAVSVFSGSEPSSGHAGNITFRSNQGDITLTNAFISSQVSQGGGNTGNITIAAQQGKASPHGNISLTGTQVANVIVDGFGKVGGIQITGRDLLLNNSEIVENNNLSRQLAGNIALLLEGRLSLIENSLVHTGAEGPANAANLIVKARDIFMTDHSRLFTGTVSSGAGGTIMMTATNQVSMTNGALITTRSTGKHAGDAGDIKIDAGQQLELHNGSSITTTTESKQANGGNIEIRAIDRVRIVNSNISTSVKGEAGSGGNIFIDPNVVILQGSTVTAKAVGGAGGNITFVTPLYLADAGSVVSASSQRGPSGTVTIQSPTSNLSGTVGQLTAKTNPQQVLVHNRCAALAGGQQSTLVLAGRHTLPSEPGGWLRSPVSMDHWTGTDTDHASGLMGQSRRLHDRLAVVAPKDKTEVPSLRRLTPPGFLVRTFATGPTGCPS